ncbi:hypothetical protein JCM19297_1394 [Nonlabens ulvanivorans]|nr:hypothetical protein JCM19297_1394 [Nonlabens ulvanivorans]
MHCINVADNKIHDSINAILFIERIGEWLMFLNLMARFKL